MADPLDSNRSSNQKRGRSDYREFFNVVSRVVAENPDAVAAFEDHLRRYDRAALVGNTFGAATTQHQEILDAFLETDAGRAAAQKLGEAYQRLAGQLKTSPAGTPQQNIIPIIIGGLVLLDILIWGCVFTDCL